MSRRAANIINCVLSGEFRRLFYLSLSNGRVFGGGFCMPIRLDNRPIFMLGAERSGTTLVMAMLGCHERIAVPEVVWYYPRFRPYLFSYGDLSKDANLRVLAEEMVFGLKTAFWGMKVNPRTIVDEILGDLKERSFAGIYCAMHE